MTSQQRPLCTLHVPSNGTVLVHSNNSADTEERKNCTLIFFFFNKMPFQS